MRVENRSDTDPLVILKHFGPGNPDADRDDGNEKADLEVPGLLENCNQMDIAKPKLHNAMWPGLVGKGGPDAEPPIDLDTMLDLTAKAQVDGTKFDGVDLFLFDPHVSIDSTNDDLKRLADKIRGEEPRSSARWSRRCGRRPAADRRWAATRSARPS